ncbi:MAG TPA: BrnA antitoxin family protein [Candidatus Hydrogenedentes bacterium]|nr:BrnA antitoxin family protein [Candidatus Hydrogenedentota bacterium]
MKKRVPVFKTEESEREFWAREDSTEYVDWSKAKRAVFPNLKPSLRTISIRLPESMIEQLKLLANQRDVPYQSLLKIYLAERIQKEVERHSVKTSK